MSFYHRYLTSENEKPVLFLRRHPFTFVTTLLGHAVLLCIPLVFFFLFPEAINTYWNHNVIGIILRLGLSVYYLSMWLFLFHNFVDYYLDIWIVTTERIINIEQEGLFARTVSELKLTQIQDITSEVRGLFSTFFDYGSVYVQTAAEHGHFHFKDISNPYRTSQEIMRLRDVCKANHRHEEEQ